MDRIKMNHKMDKTFEEGFEEFVLDMKARNLRQGTISHYSISFSNFFFHNNFLFSFYFLFSLGGLYLSLTVALKNDLWLCSL